MTGSPPQISMIVPTLEEDRPLAERLEAFHEDSRVEVIVVGAKEAGLANRAFQMNLGACQARGEVLVFIHVDTTVALKDLWIIYQVLKEDPKIVGGAFRFALDQDHWKARLIEWGVRLREWFFNLPYGDQAIFVRRSIFHEIGGYPEVPLLEDVLLIQKMKTKGRLLSFPKKSVTSARRWERHGYLKMTLVNWTTMILWRLGVSLDKIVRFRWRAFNDSVRGNAEKKSARHHAETA